MEQFETMQEESQSAAAYSHTSFDPSSLRMSLSTLTHDYYMLELPPDTANSFYRYLPSYLDEHNFRG
jgi:hypothetical protein